MNVVIKQFAMGLSLFAMIGCTTVQRNVAVGAGVGTVAGAVVGSTVGAPVAGAVVGGVVGAGTGYVLTPKSQR